MAYLNKIAYFPAAILLYGIVLFTLSIITYAVSQSIWRPFDILSYYGLADPVVKAIGPYMGTKAYPLILFTLTLPGNGQLLGLFIVSLLELLCALIVMQIGLQLYGREAGLLAGLLFIVNIAWAQGYFTLTEPLALLLVLLSAYALFCLEGGARFFMAGLCIGAAICFTPFVALMVPAALYALYKRKELSSSIDYIVGAFLALVVIISLVLLLHVANVEPSLIGHDYQVAVSYLDGYRTSDAMVAIADIALSVCMLFSLLPLAIMGFIKCDRRPSEEYFMLAGLALIFTLFVQEYMNYWFFVLPFLALICASYRRRTYIIW